MLSQVYVVVMSSRLANRMKKKVELIQASKENPGAEKTARENGIAVGKRVRYELDGERYGVVKSLHPRSVVVELSAGNMLTGGEDIVVLTDEIPFSSVREVLGDGRLAQPKPPEKRMLYVAPRREKLYTTCDHCGSAIFEVLRVKGRGLVALCRGHAQGPTHDEPAPFKYRLGLIYETFRSWPRPTEEEIRARSEPQPSETESSPRGTRYGPQKSPAKRKSRPSGKARRPLRQR